MNALENILFSYQPHHIFILEYEEYKKEIT